MINFFFFSSRRRHTRLQGDWSSDVCSSDLRGVGEVSRRLRYQVLELRGQHAADLDAHAREIADQDGDLTLAAHGEERALAEDLQLGRKRRDLHETLLTVAKQVAAERAQAPLD